MDRLAQRDSIDVTSLCGVPAGIPPEGQVSNLVDPPSLSSVTLGVTIFMTVWALLFTMARVFVNFRKLKASDYFVIIAMVFDIVYVASVISMHEWARHIWDIPVCWMTGNFMKLLFWEAMMYGPTIYFAKSSLLLLYLQFFSVERPTRIATWVGLVAVGICYWSGCVIEAPFLAPHRGETWQDVVFNGRPEKISPWGLVQGPLNVVIDLYTFILPFPVLTKLHLSARRRMELCIVFSTAFLGVVVSVVALVYRVKLCYTKDQTWAQACVFLCIVLENNISIVVACMPAFAVFIKKVSDNSFLKSIKSGLLPSGRKSSSSAPSQQSWIGSTLRQGNGKQRFKTKDEQLAHDSYLELADEPQVRNAPGDLRHQLRADEWTTSTTPIPRRGPVCSLPGPAISRTREVTQEFSSSPANIKGRIV